MSAQARRTLVGISMLLVLLSWFVVGFLLAKELIPNVIAMVWLAGALCFAVGAWLYLWRTRCPRCHRLAFFKGSGWSGSSCGILGSKCVHCGVNVVDQA